MEMIPVLFSTGLDDFVSVGVITLPILVFVLVFNEKFFILQKKSVCIQSIVKLYEIFFEKYLSKRK